jgi:rifampicin phosphotransferase
MRSIVRERRTVYKYELKRRHVPRVLLSDGTEPGTQAVVAKSDDNTLKGTPASAGVIRGKARVILDPANAYIEPGEILIAPSTDLGWTPLFMTAGGLVMEMGGAMSHGAVVAREYGIPAIVGVLGATERITKGQHIIVDGSHGIVSFAM